VPEKVRAFIDFLQNRIENMDARDIPA